MFMEYPNEGFLFLLSFVRVTQYLSKFQKIWYGIEIIFGIFGKWYYTFIEYFALWTWIQHALSAFKLNWSFVLLWLSTWFAIAPSWKTVSMQNLQYPYIKLSNILIVPLFICLSKQDQAPCNAFIIFFLHRCWSWGIIGVATR